MKIPRLFTIDEEILIELKNEDNASELVNMLLREYYDKTKFISEVNIEAKKQELDLLIKAKTDKEATKDIRLNTLRENRKVQNFIETIKRNPERMEALIPIHIQALNKMWNIPITAEEYRELIKE